MDTQELLEVEIPEEVAALFSGRQLEALREALTFDPRPGYQNDPGRVYGFAYGEYDISFKVSGGRALVTGAKKNR